MHTQAHGLTYNRCIAQAVHAKHCARTRTVCTSKHTGICTLCASLRLPIPNTVDVHVECAHPRSRTPVQRRHRSGHPCQPRCKYKYSVHAHVHATTHNRCITQAAAEHCTCLRTGCTSTHAHSRTIGASLRPLMLNTVHIHVRSARSTPLACNRYTVQATHNRYSLLTAYD